MTRNATFTTLAALLLTVCFAALASGGDLTGKSARSKARYYYTAGSVEKSLGNDAAAHEYFKRAHRADPTYAEAASAYGSGRLNLPLDTLQSDAEVERSLAMIRQYVDEYPGDIFDSQYYSYVAGSLGNNEEAIRVLSRAYDANPKQPLTLVLLSTAYAKAGDLKNAVRALDRYELSEGLKPQITTQKLSFLLAAGDTVGALRQADRLIASDISNPDYVILKGNLYEVLQQPDSALSCYTRAEALDPEAGNAKMALAGYYRERGDSAVYDAKMYEMLLCEDIDLESKGDVLARYLQTLLNDKHDTERGDYLFSVLRAQYPHEAQVLDLAARYSAAKGNLKEAEEEISYALDQDAANMTYWGQLMTYQAMDNRYDDALATYGRAIEHGTPDDNLKVYYGMVAMSAKRYDLASKVYLDFIEEVQPGLQPDSLLSLSDLRRDISLDQLDMLSRYFASLGDVYHEAGENKRAYRMYDNALILDPSNYMAANNYAYFLSQDGGDLQKALELSKTTIDGPEGDNPTYIDTYAWLNYLKGELATAEQWQQKAIDKVDSLQYKSAELYDHMGDIKSRLGKPDEALDYWKKAASIMEENEQTDEPEYAKILDKIKDNDNNDKSQKEE